MSPAAVQLTILTLVMVGSSTWLWRKTRSQIVIIANVCAWLCIGYAAGFIA